MTENVSKSKLKRKKCPDEELKSNQSEDTGGKRSQTTRLVGNTEQSTVAWWNRPELPAAEKLWAYALQSALPRLETQLWDLVPDLPLPPAGDVKDPLGWDVCDDAPSSSEIPASTPKTLEPQEDLVVKTKAAPQPLSAPTCPDLQTSNAQQVLSRTQSGKEEMEHHEKHHEKHHKELAENVETPARQNQEENQSVSSEETPELERRVDGGRDGGGLELKSCPMCSEEFPAGFTQMECDSHLAQCLSDMNVDMNW